MKGIVLCVSIFSRESLNKQFHFMNNMLLAFLLDFINILKHRSYYDAQSLFYLNILLHTQELFGKKKVKKQLQLVLLLVGWILPIIKFISITPRRISDDDCYRES